MKWIDWIVAHLYTHYTSFIVDTSAIYTLIAKMISKFVNQEGVDKILNLTSLPFESLLPIWKNHNEEGYNNILNNYIARDEFDIIPLLIK